MTYGGIEAGGTKVICASGTGPDDVRALERISTTTPTETLQRMVAFFEKQPEQPAAVGIGSFGPVDVNPASSTYGHIVNTPKEGWSDFDFAGAVRRALGGVPVAFDIDVAASALGEQRWGATQASDLFAYLTIGTGIGGCLMQDGRPLRGPLHSELGHIRVPRASDDDFEGVCPFHGDCLEGLANGPAIEARWGTPPPELPPDHPAWAMEAHYLAAALANLVCVLPLERIVMGGGVMEGQPHLFPAVCHRLRQMLGGYLNLEDHVGALEDYIVPPALEGRAGVLGALAMAQDAAADAPSG